MVFVGHAKGLFGCLCLKKRQKLPLQIELLMTLDYVPIQPVSHHLNRCRQMPVDPTNYTVDPDSYCNVD